MDNPHGIILFLSALLLISIANNISLKKLSRYRLPDRYPFISVLVPARNEENNIYKCVTSLLDQDYPNFEVIVNNDSSDRTGEILESLSAEYGRLKVIHSAHLEEGWVGKQWSCHRLYREARGEYLLFVDADTVHHPEMLKHAMGAALETGADLLTMFPFEETATIGERLIVPFMHWSMISIFPMFLMRLLKIPQLVIAVGQFMMFRREAYEAIDGHSGIKDKPVDDVALARSIVGHGFRLVVVDGTEYVRCRMFNSFSDAHAGFSRSLFGAMGYKVIPFLFMWTWILIVFWQPLVMIALFLINGNDVFLRPSLVAVGMSYILFFITFKRFGFSLLSVALYPVIVLLSYTAAIRSLFTTLTGRTVWKGRMLLHPKVRLF